MRKSLFVSVSTLLMISLTAMPAMAEDWSAFSVHVTIIQTSFVPQVFDFQVDKPPSACASGEWIFYFGQGPDTPTQQANLKAVLATLLAAQLSGRAVNIFGLNPGSNGYCTLDSVHLLNQ